MNEFRPADVGRELLGNGGVATITAYTDDQHVTLNITEAFPSTELNAGDWVITGSPLSTVTPSTAGPAGGPVTLNASIGTWRPTDVGSFVRINSGIVLITDYTDPLVVSGQILEEMLSAVAAPPFAWTLEDSMWGGVYGFPRCGVIYGRRLWLGGSPGFPTFLWGSIIGEYLDFTLGTFDTDGISYDVNNGEYNQIVHLAASDALLVMTAGGELTAVGGQEKPITPTNIQIRDQSAFGSFERVAPLRVGSEFYMTQRSGKKMRALSANEFNSEQYNAPDVTVMADHMTEPGIVAAAYRPEPDSLLFAVRADGQLAALTADRDQDVFGWTRRVTQGNFESIETVPVEGGWATYAIVSRSVGGVLQRYIEKFEVGLHTDSALVGVSTGGATVWSGLGHLEGMTVDAKGDGVYLGAFVVTGGEITIPRPAFNIEIGLHYSSTILTQTPEFSVPVNPNQAAQLSTHNIIVRLHETIGCQVNLQEVAFRRLGLGVLDVPPAPFTGDKQVGNTGWESGKAQVLIQQTLPYDFHVLAVMQKMTIND